MFKKFFILSILIFFLSTGIVLAIQVKNDEKIERFSSDITIDKNANVLVQETITYNFGSFQRHGIFRHLPSQYRNADGSLYTVTYTVQSVTDEHGVSYLYSTSYEGGNFVIKIGDAHAFVQGIRVYKIRYEAHPVISYFEDHDELYWNVIGGMWRVPIDGVDVRVTVPASTIRPGSATSTKNYVCYVGTLGSKEESCVKKHPNNTTYIFSSTSSLAAYEGFTIVVGLPKNVVSQSVIATSTIADTLDNPPPRITDYSIYSPENAPRPWGLLLPIVTLVAYFVLKNRFNSEPKGLSTVIPQYESPDNLGPLEVGALFDKRVDNHDISSLFIDLAVRGFVRIQYITTNKKTDYKIIQCATKKSLQKTWEAFFIQKIFAHKKEVLISDLVGEFYDEAREINRQVLSSLTAAGYINTQKPLLRKYFVWAGVLWLPVGIVFSFATDNPWYMVGGFLSAIVSLVCACGGAPFYTKKGAETRDAIQGFRWFLSVTEEERLKFHNAPTKKPALFEKFLPYAMVLDVEEEWAEQFADIYTTAPAWFEGSYDTIFNTTVFSKSLASFTTSTIPHRIVINNSTSTFRITPSSSSGFSSSGRSGGSSGGGFGGGGGGSW